MKRTLIILLKGAPVIAGCFLLALFIARKMVAYTPNGYQVIARVKLDDQKYSFSGNDLYEDFDVFTSTNKIGTEAEVLKSPLLVGEALDSLRMPVSIARIGQVKRTQLFDDTPVLVKGEPGDPRWLDLSWRLDVGAHGRFELYLMNEEATRFGGQLGTPVMIAGAPVLISRNEGVLAQRGLEIAGSYELVFHSREGLIASVIDRLDVTAVDKEVAVLRVVYKDEHPVRAAAFVNALCKAYVDDYVSTKSQAAQQTTRFIDEKLKRVGADLDRAEAALEHYKKANGVVNTLQETETGLRQISSLRVQRINLEMNERAVVQLEDYIANGEYFDDAAINFGFGDLLLTEMAKRLKQLRDERRDLLFRYTEGSAQVNTHDQKIAEVVRYIKEALKRNKTDIATKRAELDDAIKAESHQFDGLSKRERDMQVLEREFRLQQQVYEFLSQKRIEASIAASASYSFHRVIQPAIVPKQPISPNRTLITFVSGLLGLVGGIALVLLWHMSRGRVRDREEIEKNSDVPLAGVIRHGAPGSDFDALLKAALVRGEVRPGVVIAVASTLCREGRSTVALGLVKALVRTGWRVALVELVPVGAGGSTQHEGWCHIVRPVSPGQHDLAFIEGLRNGYEVVVVDAPPTAMSADGVQVMKAADRTLFVVRAGHTSLTSLVQPDLLRTEYGLEQMRIVLNDAHRATNYSGAFIGTRYHHGLHAKGAARRLRAYLLTYMRP
jgi:uncharacterized protein involved in exopolysaccharide biosynthesis